jgi:ADP-ribosylglycohydrolase
MTEITLLERYKGAMVGVHVGDAIGAPYEKTYSAEQIAKDIAARGELSLFDYPDPWSSEVGEDAMFPAGRPTDDSDQTADLAWSLIECAGLNVEHLREALRDSVIRGKSRLWSWEATGAGGTTKKALSDDPTRVAEAMANNIGTNGSLMRSVPMALWLRGKLDCARVWNNASYDFCHPSELIWKMSGVTHANKDSKMACEIYCFILDRILMDTHPKYRENFKGMVYWLVAVKHFESSELYQRIHKKLMDDKVIPIDPGQWPERGTAEFSLYAALWCFMHSTSFADGIEKAVRIGGDTDTYAAIAGGLLGAYYGYDAIPLEWRNTILGHDVMVDYAEKLYDMNQQE